MQVTAEQIRSVKRLYREETPVATIQGGRTVPANSFPAAAQRFVGCFSRGNEKTIETMRVGRAD